MTLKKSKIKHIPETKIIFSQNFKLEKEGKIMATELKFIEK